MDLIKYVNVELGTNSERRLSQGNTLPMLCRPFSMQGLTLKNVDNGSWFYNPNINILKCFRITQQPSPWIGDFGYLEYFPVARDLCETKEELYSAVNKQLSPIEFNIDILRIGMNVRLLSTRYSIINYFTSKVDDEINISIKKDNIFVISQSKKEINLISTNIDNKFSKNNELFKKYYYVNFNQEISKCEEIGNYYIIRFKNKDVRMDITSSFISFEQAKLNYLNEKTNTYKLDSIKEESESIWNNYLKILDFDSENKEDIYSNIYRLCIYPFNITEFDELNHPKYFAFDLLEVKEGQMISGIGFWDAYRTNMPLISLFYPHIFKVIINSMLNYYKDSGWLPRWLSPNEVGCMPSTMCDIVICQAINQNVIEDKDISLCIEALKKNAYEKSDDSIRGRSDILTYISKGYVNCEEEESHSVTTSLDYYYCDYVIGRTLAKVEPQVSKELLKRSESFKRHFDKETNLFVPLNINCKKREDFNKYDWGYDYCESSALQNRFNVPFDIKSLIELYGGKKNVEKAIDELLNMYPKFNVGKYEQQIHEQTEMSISKLGQIAISNQPSFLIPFMYLLVGCEEKFYSLREIILSEFEGKYPGDEDNGSLSGWYIWLLIGAYPIEPATGHYVHFTPMLENLKLFVNGNYINSSELKNVISNMYQR